MQTLPEMFVGAARRRYEDAHDFVQSQGVGVPNGQMADDGARSLLRAEYDFAPWAGTQSALGLMPSGDPEGGMEPSLYQNLREGNYGTAAGQAISMVPEVGPAAAKGAVGLGALYKAMTMAQPEVKAALDPSLSRIFMVADPAKDAAAGKAIDMAMQGRGHTEIWDETNRLVSPTSTQAIRELPGDERMDFTQFGKDVFMGNANPPSGGAKVKDYITHPELRAQNPEIMEKPMILRRSDNRENYYNAGTGLTHIQGPWLYNPYGEWNGDLLSSTGHELTHSALFGSGAFDHGVPGGPDLFEKSKFISGLTDLLHSRRNAAEGDAWAHLPPSAEAELVARHYAPNATYGDAVSAADSPVPWLHEEAVMRALGQPTGETAKITGYYVPYMRNFQEWLARQAQQRRTWTTDQRRAIAPGVLNAKGDGIPFRETYEVPEDLAKLGWSMGSKN